MLRIHQALQAGGFPNASKLAREVEVSTKTIHRDIEFMRDRLNLPVEFAPSNNGYFYNGEVSAFPTMQITEGEIFALVVAEKALQQYRGTSFEKPLLSAIRKMEQALPDTISLNLADIEQTISFRTRAEPILNLEIFDALAKAVAQRQQLELHYRKPGQPVEKRLVDAYHLANINGEWYLFAYDHARKDLRTFVPARIQSVKPTGKTFERTQKFSLEKRLRDSFGVHSGEGEFERRDPLQRPRRRLHPRKEMASVTDVARLEGRGSGIENEAVQSGRSATLGLELGRRCESVEAEGTCRICPRICPENSSFRLIIGAIFSCIPIKRGVNGQ